MSSSPAATRAWPQTSLLAFFTPLLSLLPPLFCWQSLSFSLSFSFLHAKNSVLPIPTLWNREEITLPSRCTVKLPHAWHHPVSERADGSPVCMQ